MSKAGFRLRRWLFWGVPAVILLVALLLAFLYWLIATPTGARWALHTAVQVQKGSIQGVQGTLWHGLQFDELDLPLPDDGQVVIKNFDLQVQWWQLWQQRRLEVRRLSVGDLNLRLHTQEDSAPEPEEPFALPELPIAINVDELVLGHFQLELNDEPLDVELGQLQAMLHLDGALNARLQSLQVGYEDIRADLTAQVHLPKVAAPWPAEVQAQAKVRAVDEQAPICMHQFIPEHLQQRHAVDAEAAAGSDETADSCLLNFALDWQGSLDSGQLKLNGAGQGFHLRAQTDVALEADIPVNYLRLEAQLPDDSSLEVFADWMPNRLVKERAQLFATIKAHEFNLGPWLVGLDIPAVLNLDFDGQVTVDAQAQKLYQASTTLEVHEGTQWNNQAIQGQLGFDVALDPSSATAKDQPAAQPFWLDYVLSYAHADLALGSNHLALEGRWAQNPSDRLQLQLQAPALQELWPDLEPIGATELALEFSGDWQRHRLELEAAHELSPAEIEEVVRGEGDAQRVIERQKLGTGLVKAHLDLQGALTLHNHEGGLPFDRWQGQLNQFGARHAAFGLESQNAVDIEFLFDRPQRPMAVNVGAWTVQTQVEQTPWLTLVLEQAFWQGEQWSTKGHTEPVRFSADFIDLLMRNVGVKDQHPKRGGIVFRDQEAAPLADLELQLSWDVAFKEALQGQVRLARIAGDIMVPDEPPFPLELNDAYVDVNLRAQGPGLTEVTALALFDSTRMGVLQAELNTPLHFSPEHGVELRESDLKTVRIDANMDDLSWTQFFTGDAMDLRGSLQAQVEMQMRAVEDLKMQGTIRGEELRVTRLDDGVRLLDGTLEARLDNQRFIIDRLHFPALLRVEPKEWRTATWITEEEDAKNGYLDLTGFWDLEEATGEFKVVLHRYPILQRADRYAMMSGEIDVDAVLPQLNIKGKLTADAGWFDLDMLGGIPTLDGDVVVIRAGDEPQEEEELSPLDMSMDLEIDLGPRFYLTGYGVNSGLVGQLRVMMVGDELTGLGALRTRGGSIEAYGQRLLLRRGTITFQGDIANPILNIEALRTGQAVEAGVRVAGTARHPKIDLISYPEVDELAKLSWLLFGHGPDESGGDIALLISVGTSMLSDGEPFYKRFGIDELSLQSGEIGGAGSILPPTSTASSLESEVSEVEKRFIQATKVFSRGFTVGVRQALADSGTVGRATYRLTRGLTAELTVGTVSGMALLYRWFSRDD